jgi:hypothetical protein
VARQQEMGLVLVECRARDLAVGHERRQLPGGTRVPEDLQVEIGERDDGPDAELRAQLLQRRHVAGVVEARHRALMVGGVLGGRERVGVGRDRDRQLRERRDERVALADAGDEDGDVAFGPHATCSPAGADSDSDSDSGVRSPSAIGSQPPPSPL